MRHNDPVSANVISAILLVLAVVLVVLTRLRLARSDDPGAGRLDIPLGLVNAHTALGTLGILLFGSYLIFETGWVVGFLGLLLWWATTVVGLLILLRWLPAKGRHASEGSSDEWTEGPWLSMVGHLGALVGAVVWTLYFAMDKLT
jgi:hypothetical protein